MAQGKTVPKFGDWDSEQSYTEYFEKTKKKKKKNGKTSTTVMINQEDMFTNLPKPAVQRQMKQKARSSYRADQRLHHHFPMKPSQSDGSSHGRPKPSAHSSDGSSRGDVAVIPKFGDWNELDQDAAEKLSHMFERARHEKNPDTAAGYVLPTNTPPSDAGACRTSHAPNKKWFLYWCCC